MFTSRRISLSILALAIVGLGLTSLPRTRTTNPTPQVAGLQISDKAIQARIARKQAERDGTFQPANNPDGFAEFRRMMRPHPEGTTVTGLLLKARKEVDRMPALAVDKSAGIWDWTWLGPGNIGGRIRAIITHPTDPNTLWIGAASGGVWKTVTGGSDWFPLMDFLPSMAVSAMAIDPGNPNILYAATGEGLASGLPGAGIFKSNNGGATWNQLAATTGAKYINDLAIHPTNGQILLAAVSVGGDGEIWRSLDGGLTWNSTLAVPGEQFTDVAMDPDDPSIVLASTTNRCYRSDIVGNPGTWDLISTGLPGGLPADPGRATFSFGVGNDVVYASCDVARPEDPTQQGEIWLSADNGLTWEQRATPYHLGKQGTYDNVIWLEPGSTQNIMFGGINLYKSYNGGILYYSMSNWAAYHTGLSAHADQHVIVPGIQYGNNDATIYFGNDGGIQRTEIGFATTATYGWRNLANNLGITQFFHADVSPGGDLILGGTQDNDDLRYYRSQGAQNWYQATTGDGTYNAIDPLDQSRMYAAYVYLKMERSTNGGDDYGYIINGLDDATDPARALFIAPFALDKINPNHLIAGGKSIWHTNDYGDSWHEALPPVYTFSKCSATEVSPTVGAQVSWVGYQNGALWRSDDLTQTWSSVESPSGGWLPDSHVSDIEISPHDPNVVLVVLSGYYPDRVWLTRDNGLSWVSLQGTGTHTLPLVGINCVTFHPTDPDWIYVGTDIGLFASEDMGQNWSVTPRYTSSEGPVYVEVTDLLWYAGQNLVAVTYGRGIWECRPLSYVFVDLANTGAEDGTLLHPFNTVTEAYDFMQPGMTMSIAGGDYSENGILMLKQIYLQSNPGEKATIK